VSVYPPRGGNNEIGNISDLTYKNMALVYGC
jgi:hypothetical protein